MAWRKILKFLKQCKGVYVGREYPCKNFMEAIYWMSRTGAQWRELHDKYGNWNSIFKRFNAWSKKNFWSKLLQFCIEEPDLEYVMIDATVVQAHACAAGYGEQKSEGLGRSSGGFSTKIHAKVDALGNPLQFIITSGQTSDVTQAKSLLQDLVNSHVIADKAYGSNEVRKHIKNLKSIDVIPSKTNSLSPVDYDKHIYKERHVIECFFQRSNILDGFSLDLISQLAITQRFYHLWGHSYGYDKKPTEPSKNLYVTAKELSKSAELQAAYPITISDIQLVDAEADICMLTVEQDHNFFVSEQDVLAHNIAPLFVLVPFAAPASVGVAATIIIPAVKFAGFAVGGWIAAKFFGSFICRPPTDGSIPQNHEPPKYMECGNHAGPKSQNGLPEQKQCNLSNKNPNHMGCGNAESKNQFDQKEQKQCNHSKGSQASFEHNKDSKKNDEKTDSKSRSELSPKEGIILTRDNDKNPIKGKNNPEKQQPKDEKSKSDKKPDDSKQTDKRPNGIYEGAPYHNQNSKGDKSPAPKNGQKALDESIPLDKIGNTPRRLSVEGEGFVVLDQTSKGKFHGHTRTWDELLEPMKQRLIEEGFVNRKGKIIK